MSNSSNLEKTPFYDIHVKLGARLIEFGGWLMPVQYKGIIEEHNAVRKAAGLFDLSHMGEVEVSGFKALEFLQFVTTNDVSKLEVGQAHYTFLCYPDGGIVDDLIVYRLPDKYLLVVNASNAEKDYAWLQESRTLKGFDCILRNASSATALLALQGPRAIEILQPLVANNLNEIAYYHCAEGELEGVSVLLARTGYTGEDGFELFFNKAHAEKIWNLLAEAGQAKGLQPIGLGARDTLRLEAKMALYGNDIDATSNPFEAGLGWAVKLDKGNFTGKAALEKFKASGLKRKLVGFEMKDRSIARHGYPVAIEGEVVGVVTSGSPSPTTGKNIGLAYVPLKYATLGTSLQVIIRNKPAEALVVKTPFYARPGKPK
ncbi:MAG: glycine cleavage system aminomethyltransferase GcvT [Chloroflexi bacterium]|nr:glycine cleavage system aminomethyltransferase GcvT [Chloroflexota bacterium]